MVLNAQVIIKSAVQHRPALSKEGLLERLFSFWFDGFVYNQIWEDPRVDMEAMKLDSNSRIMTIASGGCNILYYLTALPEAIYAVDLNPYHLHFNRLKHASLKHLPDYETFFEFWGDADKKENLDRYFSFIQSNLDPKTREYWEGGTLLKKMRLQYFTKNIYNYGTMGYFIRFVHLLGKLCGVDAKEILSITDQDEREAYFDKKFSPFFNNFIVKMLGKMPFTFYSLGIPPQQYDAMRQECNGKLNELCLERVKRLVCQFPIEENYFAWQAFSCKYDRENRRAVPDYLKEEHYELLKKNLQRVSFHWTSTTEFLKHREDECLNRFVLLDSQDWMDEKVLTELWTEIARVGMPGSRIIFRTASYESPLENALPTELRSQFTYEEERSKELFKQDRSAIYGGFHLYVKKG